MCTTLCIPRKTGLDYFIFFLPLASTEIPYTDIEPWNARMRSQHFSKMISSRIIAQNRTLRPPFHAALHSRYLVSKQLYDFYYCGSKILHTYFAIVCWIRAWLCNNQLRIKVPSGKGVEIYRFPLLHEASHVSRQLHSKGIRGLRRFRYARFWSRWWWFWNEGPKGCWWAGALEEESTRNAI